MVKKKIKNYILSACSQLSSFTVSATLSTALSPLAANVPAASCRWGAEAVATKVETYF